MLASATKSNALQYSMVFWDEVTDTVAEEFRRYVFGSTTWTRLLRGW